MVSRYEARGGEPAGGLLLGQPGSNPSLDLGLGRAGIGSTQRLPHHRDAGLEHLDRSPETSRRGVPGIASGLGHIRAVAGVTLVAGFTVSAGAASGR